MPRSFLYLFKIEKYGSKLGAHWKERCRMLSASGSFLSKSCHDFGMAISQAEAAPEWRPSWQLLKANTKAPVQRSMNDADTRQKIPPGSFRWFSGLFFCCFS